MAIISMNGWGEVKFLDNNENEITDYYEIQDLKRNTNWKEIVYNQSLELINEINKNIDEERSFYLKTEKLINENEIFKKISDLKLKEYKIPEYPGKLSSGFMTQNALEVTKKNAKKNVSIFPLRNRKKRIETYIKDNFPKILTDFENSEKDKETAYFEIQKKIKAQKDSEFKIEYDKRKSELEKFITTDDKTIESSLTDIGLRDLEGNGILKLSVGFACFQCVDYSNKSCKIILFVPDVFSLEDRSAKMLASGKISVKKRNFRDMESDWNLFCCGAILNVAAKIFNLNTNIKSVEIESHYTIENEVTGQNEEYKYENTFFSREDFKNLNIHALNPIKTIQFYHKDNDDVLESDDLDENEQYETNNLNTINVSDDNSENEDISGDSNKLLPEEAESLTIINNCLEKVSNNFDSDIFYQENSKKFLAACRDFYPDYDVETNFLGNLSEAGILEQLARKKLEEDFLLQFIETVKNFSDDGKVLAYIFIILELIFDLPLQELFSKNNN